MLSPARTPRMEFYERLSQSKQGTFELQLVLADVRHFLLDPLAFLGLAAEGADESSAQRIRAWSEDVRRLNQSRFGVIQKYAPSVKHPAFFDALAPLRPEWFTPEFWAVASAGGASLDVWRTVLTEHLPGEVFSMQMFTDEFCDAFVEELQNFQATGLPARRPNSMNRYGIILGDIGLEPFVTRLQALLQPLGHLLFPGPGTGWDGHHCFTVRYRADEDLGLDMHTDDSDVTFNVCLGLEFTGAGLQFCGMMGALDHRQHSLEYRHQKGRCVVHLGRKRHGADNIESGDRVNLILWNTSSAYRRSNLHRAPLYHREAGPPETVCLSYTHDRDFGVFKPYPDGAEAFRHRGWCPPSHAEYEGFRPDAARVTVGDPRSTQ